MTVYKEQRSHGLKLVLAIVVFILAMTVTFSDVYGVGVPMSGKHSSRPSVSYTPVTTSQNSPPATDYVYSYPMEDYDRGGQDPEDPSPEGVPEPGTLLLMALGVGVLSRRFKKS